MRNKTVTQIKQGSKLGTSLTYVIVCLIWAGGVSLSLIGSKGLVTDNIHLSAAQLRLISLAFALPGLLIWMTTLFAALSIRRYARTITGAKESAGFRYIAYGVLALLASLAVGSYLGGIQQLVSLHAANPDKIKTTFVIINNYVSVITALATYGLLMLGGRSLLRTLRTRYDTAKKLLPLVIAFGALTIGYLWLIHHNPARQVSIDRGINPTFGLPYWLIVLTVAVPFAVAWFMGAVALFDMYIYRTKTTGIVYKMFFKKLVIGMTLLIGITVFLQLFTQLYTLYADRSISSLLGIITIIYLILTYAFVLMAQAAQKLNKIETMIIE